MFETTDWLAPQLPVRQAALLHGHRRPRGDPRSDRGRCRHVRLRASHPHRQNRQRAHLGGPPQPRERALRPRSRAARPRLPCPACTGYSRAYIRHLVNQEELLALRLLSLHNLRFVLELTAARARSDRARRLRLLQARRPRPTRASHRHVIVIVLLLAVLVFLLAVPARRRQRSHAAMQDEVSSATRSSPQAACTRSCARRTRTSSGSRSLPASSSRSTAGRLRRSRRRETEPRAERTQRRPARRRRTHAKSLANLSPFVLAPLPSHASS